MAGNALSEAAIRQLAAPESFKRGQEYYAHGAVTRLVRRGDELQADVQGSEYAPYRVTVSFEGAEIGQTRCTCPYDWGGICKHVVAVLLAFADEPEAAEQRSTIDELLRGLDRDQLEALVRGVVKRDPDLLEAVELEAQRSATKALSAGTGKSGKRSSGKKKAKTSTWATASAPALSVETALVRRQVKAALRSLDTMRSSEAYWHVGSVAREVLDVAEEARPLIDAGDARNALAVLQAVTEEYLRGWEELDDSGGEASSLFYELAPLWCEALLCGPLDKKERDGWRERLERWQKEVEDYGPDSVFEAPIRAASEGWEHPDVKRALKGKATRRTPRRAPRYEGDGDDPDLADVRDWGWELAWDPDMGDRQLAQARLRSLDRQGRVEEYLNLAAAEGLVVDRAKKLAALGRAPEALEHALEDLATAGEALAVSEALAGGGAREEAQRLAEHGLTLAKPRAPLARWLRDQAAADGRTDLAITASRVAFGEDPSLEDYRRLRDLAGERWPALREELLSGLRGAGTRHQPAQVDVFLDEGLVEDAIAAVDGTRESYLASSHYYDLLRRVARAAAETHPDWVIPTCRRRSEQIMNEGRSQYYAEAADWLSIAGESSRAAGRLGEWRTYMEGLLEKHARKYRLIPLLKQVFAQT